MRPLASPMWEALPEHMAERIQASLRAGLDMWDRSKRCRLFFRADDIAVPGNQLTRLMALFVEYQAPLCLAVVPAWLTRQRWRCLEALARGNASLFCWHQHGWRHANHEKTGKKQEFGPGRSKARIRADLCQGRDRLKSLMGASFVPVFTPPWNRCSPETLAQLKPSGFLGVSRRTGASPPAPPDLPDLSVNVDLHTRKEPDPASAWQALFKEIAEGIGSGTCGIMIHHRRMNPAGFLFLESLLKVLSLEKGIRLCRFQDMMHGRIVDPVK